MSSKNSCVMSSKNSRVCFGFTCGLYGFRLYLTVGLMLILSTGCQPTKKLDVFLTEEGLTFGNKEIVEEVLEGRGYMLSSIEVKQLDCDNDCIMWSMVRERDPEKAMPDDIHAVMGEILYGRRAAGMIVPVEAKSLVAGEYVVTAIVDIAPSERRPRGMLFLKRQFGIQRLGVGRFEIVYLD